MHVIKAALKKVHAKFQLKVTYLDKTYYTVDFIDNDLLKHHGKARAIDSQEHNQNIIPSATALVSTAVVVEMPVESTDEGGYCSFIKWQKEVKSGGIADTDLQIAAVMSVSDFVRAA